MKMKKHSTLKGMKYKSLIPHSALRPSYYANTYAFLTAYKLMKFSLSFALNLKSNNIKPLSVMCYDKVLASLILLT